ncbi:hypothetical protein NECAME_08713 [Necator americanus]|uniref:Uncharacterized protein n=1 Tax=Necator americanus TaxID=51031 RepID=W2TJ91_NECAM|nr:hypothetical protein NECAME_08713 [Necator americanus]ETN81092.1 hypothetical protein NECAME_08713 [Necator americanus]
MIIARTVLWIDASYKAEDFKLNTTSLPECQSWRTYWSLNSTSEEEDRNSTSSEDSISLEELAKKLKETELIKEKKKLKKIGLNEKLLDEYKAVGLVYKEICGDHGRTLWFRDTTDAKNIGITEKSLICEPFKVDLTPDIEKLATLAKMLDELVENSTKGIVPTFSTEKTSIIEETDVVATVKDELLEQTKAPEIDKNIRYAVEMERAGIPEQNMDFKYGVAKEIKKSVVAPEEEGASFLVVEEAANHIVKVEEVGKWKTNGDPPQISDLNEKTKKSPWMVNNDVIDRMEDYPENNYQHGHYKVIHHHRTKREEEKENERKPEATSSDNDDDDDWLLTMNKVFTESLEDVTDAGEGQRKNATEYKWIKIEYSEEAQYVICVPTLLLSSTEAVEGLALKIPSDALKRYENVGLYLPGICADYVPKSIDEFDSSSFEGVEIEGPIGVNITALEAAGVNLTALAEKLRNDTEVDDILSRTNGSTK